MSERPKQEEDLIPEPKETEKGFDPEIERAKIEARYSQRMSELKKIIEEMDKEPGEEKEDYSLPPGWAGKKTSKRRIKSAKELEQEEYSLGPNFSQAQEILDSDISRTIQSKREEIEREKAEAIEALQRQRLDKI